MRASRGLDIDGKLVNGEVRDYNWAEIVQRSAKGIRPLPETVSSILVCPG